MSGTILRMRLCLLPSPLTTPAVVGRLAANLGDRGHQAVVADRGGADVSQVLDGFIAAAHGADVVVPHSNAGRFGPAVAEAVGAELVCLDSLLPGPDNEPEWAEFLRSQEMPDGLLAPWSTWWPREELQAVVGEHWDLLTADEPRVSLRMLVDQPPAPEHWLARRSGYIAFGDTYGEQTALAEAHGWEVRRLAGGHLHLLTDPAEVAETLLEVAGRLR